MAQSRKRQTKEGLGFGEVEKTWPAWVRKGFMELECAEELALKVLPLDEDMPRWACLMMKEIWRMVGPDVRPDDDSITGPFFLGAMVGHVERMASGKSGLDHALENLEKAERELNQKILGTLTKKQLAYWIRRQKESKGAVTCARRRLQQIADAFERVEQRKLKIGQRIQATAAKRPLEEKDEFLKGYTREMDRKIISEDGWLVREKATNERIRPSAIYFLMVFNWKEVNEFKDFGELRRWFEKQFGKWSVGDPDRLKHLCQRHGYNPGGSPGRPSGDVEVVQAPTVVTNYMLQTDLRKK